MKCEECNNDFPKLTYTQTTKKFLCSECRKEAIKNTQPRENIFIVHQAIKRKGAPFV